MLSRLLLLGLLLTGLGLGYRHYALGDWGWEPLHAAEFPEDGCEPYFMMLGLGQDPKADPANAALVARCQPPGPKIVWIPSQVGDSLRFDRPSIVRLRVDVIDMAPEYQETYPTMLVEFPYPPVPVDTAGRWRSAGALQAVFTPEQAQKLSRYWNPSWAGLLAQWTLGRGNHEVWLGAATIGEARYCAATEQDPRHHERVCVMHLYDQKGEPVTLRFPLERNLEWRFEVLDICHFGGRARRWNNPLTRAWFGAVEYADTGCTPYVGKAAEPALH